MTNRLWLTEDIANGLNAIYAAHEAALQNELNLDAIPYGRGFTSALTAVALAFGISPPTVIADILFVSHDEHAMLQNGAMTATSSYKNGP